jgi:hypothetical protein
MKLDAAPPRDAGRADPGANRQNVRPSAAPRKDVREPQPVGNALMAEAFAKALKK